LAGILFQAVRMCQVAHMCLAGFWASEKQLVSQVDQAVE
jgi:hypothetical protein